MGWRSAGRSRSIPGGPSRQRDLEALLVDERQGARVAVADGALEVTAGDPAKRAELAALINATYGSSLAPRGCAPAAGPGALCSALGDAHAIEQAALEREAVTVRARIEAAGVAASDVRVRGAQLVVELPALGAEALAALEAVVTRPAALAFQVVDNDAPYMKRLFTQVGSDPRGAATDPAAVAVELEAAVDQWRLEAGGPAQLDDYLVAPDREAAVSPEEAKRLGCLRADACLITGRATIERYVSALAAKDPAFVVPTDRQLGFEPVAPDRGAKDPRRTWRSYYLERAPALTGTSIKDATSTTDPASKLPRVLLELDRRGTQVFGDLTARIAGRKLATVLDGIVRSAAIVNGPIRGGRVAIALGAGFTERKAAELAQLLKLGALPAPLVLASVSAP